MEKTRWKKSWRGQCEKKFANANQRCRLISCQKKKFFTLHNSITRCGRKIITPIFVSSLCYLTSAHSRFYQQYDMPVYSWWTADFGSVILTPIPTRTSTQHASWIYGPLHLKCYVNVSAHCPCNWERSMSSESVRGVPYILRLRCDQKNLVYSPFLIPPNVLVYSPSSMQIPCTRIIDGPHRKSSPAPPVNACYWPKRDSNLVMAGYGTRNIRCQPLLPAAIHWNN